MNDRRDAETFGEGATKNFKFNHELNKRGRGGGGGGGRGGGGARGGGRGSGSGVKAY